MPRRVFVGVVVSDASDKTVMVQVQRRVRHPRYKKVVLLTKKYAAHDPENRHRKGDNVRIIESSPFSKTKSFAVMYEE